MDKSGIFKKALENVFQKLTAGHGTFKIHGYVTAEVEVRVGSCQSTIGIGFYEPLISLGIFLVDNQRFREDPERLQKVLLIGYLPQTEQTASWQVDFLDAVMTIDSSRLSDFNGVLMAIHRVVEMVEEEERKLLNKA